MPKSKLRKDHKKKAAAFRKRVEDRKKSFEKQMRALYEKQQQEAFNKQMAGGQVQTEQIEGLNVDDFQLETTPVTIPSEPTLVEGVTKPEQV